MSVLVIIETEKNKVKKSSIEAAFYASQIEDDVVALGLGSAEDLNDLGKYGVSKVLKYSIEGATPASLKEAIVKAAEETGASTVVFAKSSTADALCSGVAIKLGAGIATNVVSLPDTSSGYKLKRSVYTGKAFILQEMNDSKKVLSIKKNILEIVEGEGKAVIEDYNPSIDFTSKIVKTGEEKAEGDVLLPEAEMVVSAGRGMKGPENWGIIEELAQTLGAATACSKPVSDTDWRPHHEHVGQTGVKISPNLYIAVGISGAIQHLAGVNSSKVIVVINKDPEAPFFKAADYGIVGDLFDVVPKLNEALKASLN